MKKVYEARLWAIQELRKFHTLDIWVHFGIMILSFLVLLITSIWLIRSGEFKLAIGMFGSTGVITFVGSKALVLWTDALHFVATGDVIKRKH